MGDIILGLLLLSYFALCYYAVCRGERYIAKLKRNASKSGVYDRISVSKEKAAGEKT